LCLTPEIQQTLKLDPVLRTLEARKAELQVSLDTLRGKYGPEHRSVRNLESLIESIELQIQSRRSDLIKQALHGVRYRVVQTPGRADTITVSGWVSVEKVKAAYLGVSVSSVTGALRKQLTLPEGVGLLVDHVDPDSPAKTAGLERHDVLHKLDAQILINAHQLAVLVRTFKGGDEVQLTVIRKAKPQTISVKLAERNLPKLGPPPMWPPGLDIGRSAGRYGIMCDFVNGPTKTTGTTLLEGLIQTREQRKIREDIRDLLMGLEPAPEGQALSSRHFWAPKSQSYHDPEHTLAVTTRGDGQRYLFVIDNKSGKCIRSGLIQTAEQREALSKEILEKLERMERSFQGRLKEPTTRPGLSPGSGPALGRQAI